MPRLPLSCRTRAAFIAIPIMGATECYARLSVLTNAQEAAAVLMPQLLTWQLLTWRA
eukprot:SAG11_NODE_37633_length_256_cov_0.630573_1_plen_56_part_01